MPDLMNFKITGQADSSLTVARVKVEAQVIDDASRAVIADYTGANALQFAFRVQGWSVQQHKDFADEVAHLIIRRNLGLA